MRPLSPSSYRSALAALAALAASIGACSREEPVTLLARVGEAELTAADFARHVQMHRARTASAVDPKTLLEEWVEREVLVQSAFKAGLQDDPEVRERVRDVWIAALKERQLTPRLEEATVSEAELKTAYESEKDKLMSPERVRLAMLFVSSPPEADPETRQETRRRLEAAAKMSAQEPAAAQSGFGAVAVNVSEDQESRYRGGDIGWVERERFPPRVDPAVIQAGFALEKPGAVSEVIDGREGFYVVKLLERKAAAAPPLEQAEPALRRRLLDEKKHAIQASFESSLRKGLRIETHPERLASLPPAAPEATPPAPSIP